MRYKGILLDLDNTLYNYEYAHEKGLDSAFQYIEEVSRKSIKEIESNFLLFQKLSQSRVIQYSCLS